MDGSQRHGQIGAWMLGRLVVLEQIGAGAGGVVYLAYDPDLHRKLALKLLRPRDGDGVDNQRARARLVREAQAMARLSHPNVLTVHEIGTVGDQVYVAMEYGERGTLRDWLAEEPRGWPEIVDAFLQAGRGLAAAHAAGLVHRDFKPDNVVIGADGRVRVSDFGLVSGARTAPDPVEPARRPPPVDADDQTLTGTGVIVGTPLYMAPEQHGLGEVDARADQFAFCVALYEALHGVPPFAGHGYWDLMRAVCAGQLREPPRNSDVPARLRAVLQRGLRVRPAERYPSMEALLAELEAKPPAAWRYAVAAAAMVAVTGVVVAVATGTGDPTCGDPGDSLRGVWDAKVRRQLEAAFTATGAGHAASSVERVTRRLDDYAGAWVDMRRQACEATLVRREQSDQTFDLRMACLDRKLGELSGLTSMLIARPDRAVVDGAIDATTALSSIADCADVDALSRSLPPPAPPARAAIAAAEMHMAQARVARSSGRLDEALEQVEAARALARQADYPPLVGQLDLMKGGIEWLDGDLAVAHASLTLALQHAAEAHDDDLVAQIAVYLIELRGAFLHQVAEAHAIVPFAEAAVTRGGERPIVRGSLHHAVGAVYLAAGDYARARRELERAVALLEASGELELERTLYSLGEALRNLGEVESSLRAQERAVAVASARLGADHPRVARIILGLANTLDDMGRPDEARVRYAEALRIVTAAYGPDHVEIAGPLLGLANQALTAGEFDAAADYNRRALAIYEKARGPDHTSVALALNNLADALAAGGRIGEAEPLMVRALAIWTDVHGADHPDTALALYNLGDYARARGDHATARARFGSAAAIWERAHGRDHVNVGRALIGLGASLVDAGDTAAAIGVLERGLAISEASESQPALLGDARFALARALWSTRRARAETLLGQARAAYEQAGRAGHRGLEALRAFAASRDAGVKISAR